MNLIAWLEDLAAAYRIEPWEMTTRRYLKSLECWQLIPEQWEQLSDRAALQFAKFPSIAELYDITCELQHQAEIAANLECIAKMRDDWSLNQTDDGTGDSDSSGLRGSP